MARLPTPGGDNNNWGSILNDYLSTAHNTDGSLRNIDISKVDGLSTVLSDKAPIATKLIAGNGLTGGGNLAIDRTFEVVEDSTIQKVTVGANGNVVGSRRQINLIAGAGVTVNANDNPTDNRVDITVSANVAASSNGALKRARNNIFNNSCSISSRFGTFGLGTSDGIATGINSVTTHKATTTAADLRVVWANWTSAGSNGADTDGTSNVNLTVRIEYPVGTFWPVSFNGISSVTTPKVMAPGATLVSDAVTALPVIPAGAIFYVHAYLTVTSGGRWINTHRPNSLPNSSWCTGEGYTTGTTETDMSGQALVNPGTTAMMPGPVAILADAVEPSHKTIVGLGDSIMQGSISNRGVGQQYLSVRLADQAGIFTIGRSGGTAAELTTARGKYRWPLFSTADVLVIGYGVNDLTASPTLASLQASLISIWQKAYGRAGKVYQTTITPWSSSTDNWTTVDGQTPRASDPTRIAFNDWLRAGAPMNALGQAVTVGTVGARIAGDAGHFLYGYLEIADSCETTRNSGLWKVPGNTFTADTTAGSPTLTNVNGDTRHYQRVINMSTNTASRVISGAGTSTVTLSQNASVTATGVTFVGVNTADGVHPDVAFDTEMGALIDVTDLLA